MRVSTSLKAFAKAWDMLIDIPFPVFPWKSVPIGDGESEEDVSPLIVLYFFPVVGAVLGLTIVVFTWLLSCFAETPVVSVVSALLSVVLLEYVNKGRNSSAIVSLSEKTVTDATLAESFGNGEPPVGRTHSNLGLMILCSLFLLRVCSVGMLIYYHRVSWIPVALILSYSVQAQLAVQKDYDDEPFYEVNPPENAVYHWVVSIGGALVIGVSYLPFVLIASLIAYLFSGQFNRLAQERIGGINATLIGMGGYIVETLLLVIGLIFLVRT